MSQLTKNTTHYEDLGPQLDALHFASTRKKNEFDCLFRPWVQGNKNPYVVLRNARLGAYGPQLRKNHGLQVIDIKDADRTFMKFQFGVNSTDHANLRNLCLGVYDEFIKKKSPTTKSIEYQNMFPELTDGTMVHHASKHLVNSCLLESAIDTSIDKAYSSPSVTYGPFLFGDNPSARWYFGASVSEGTPDRMWKFVCYDSKGKQFGNRHEQETEVYKKGGIPLTSTLKMKNLVQSNFYKKTNWNVTAALRLYRIRLQLGTDANGERFIYPEFCFQVSHSIRMDEVVFDEEDGRINAAKKDTIMDNIIFNGVQAPSRKRKRVQSVQPVSNSPRRSHYDNAKRELEEDTDDNDDN